MTDVEIIFEDEAYESAFLSGDLFEAGALTLVAENGRLTSATTLRCAEDAARSYVSRFAEEPFSSEAKAFLAASLAPLFEKCGYSADPDSPYETIAFCADTSLAAAKSPPPSDVSLVVCGDGDGERYDFSLIDGGVDDGECVLAVSGDTVLCAAGINDLCRDGYAEIYVECAESHRRRGLGSACVALLVSKLISAGQGVRYETTGDNAASLALARSLGFREIERVVSFTANGK